MHEDSCARDTGAVNAVGPRLYGLKARDVDVVALIRRGPTEWCQVSRWDIDSATVEPGSWFRGTIAPQKCDLSPDGSWLLYSAVKYPGTWEGGAVYEAISRLPWLRALAAWEAGTTYTRGAHFTDDPERNDLGVPSAGSLQLRGSGIALTGVTQFAVERRNGWTDTDDTADRAAGGHWDQDREVTMVKDQPGGPATLRVQGAYAAFRSTPDWHTGAAYSLSSPGEPRPLDGAQWADWSNDGLLLSADIAGVVRSYELSNGSLTETQCHDLSDQMPNPQPPPPEASRW